MADAKGRGQGGKRFTPNPLATRLMNAGGEGSIALTGFVVESARVNHVRIVLGLDEVSDTVEVSLDDVVDISDLPKSDLGASAVWVRRGALVHHSASQPVEDFVASYLGHEPHNIQRSGLRMRVTRQARDVCTCEYYCDGTKCVPCTSRCLKIQ